MQKEKAASDETTFSVNSSNEKLVFLSTKVFGNTNMSLLTKVKIKLIS
jgi:hypothetical protein